MNGEWKEKNNTLLEKILDTSVHLQLKSMVQKQFQVYYI